MNQLHCDQKGQLPCNVSQHTKQIESQNTLSALLLSFHLMCCYRQICYSIDRWIDLLRLTFDLYTWCNYGGLLYCP